MYFIMKRIFMIAMCFCLMIVCAACQGEPGTAEPSSGDSAQDSVSRETSPEPTQTRSESTETVSRSTDPSVRVPDTSATQRQAQAVTLFSAKQAQTIDCVVYRANFSVTPDKQMGKPYELKTREEMEPVLEAVQQKVWTPTGDTWALKTSPNSPYYTLFLKNGDKTQLELRLCGHGEQDDGYIATVENGKMTRYEVPVATYQQLVKAHTFS